MKLIASAVCLALAALILLPGCSSSSDSSSGAAVDTSKVQTSFQTADADLKTIATRAVDSVKAGNWQAALNDLQALLSNAKITPEQKQAVTDLIAKVKDKIAAGAKALGDKATGAVGDLQKNLTK